MRRRSGFSSGAAAALTLWVFGFLAAGAASAQPSPAGQPLRQQVEARFDVLPLSDGLLLRPRAELSGVRAIEVRGGELAIDGREASADELERRVGAEAAAPVRALLALGAEELHDLFGFDESEEAVVPTVPVPGAPPLPPPPPGVPDDLRDRLRDQLESEGVPLDEQQEQLRERLREELERRAEEMRDREQDLERELERVHRRRRSSAERFVVGTPVRVEKGDRVAGVVSVGGGVTVDGEVEGDAVSIGAPARIDGQVDGAVIGVGGGVRLGPEARVMGDVVSVGGPLVRAPGAEVHGEVIEVSLWQGLAGGWGRGWGGWDVGPFGDRHDYFEGALGRLLRTSLGLVVLILLGILVAAVARPALERVSNRIVAEPWKAGLVGILAIVLFVPLLVMVCVLLAISIVGIPLLLLVPFAVLACVFLVFFGYLAAAHALGRWSERRFGWRVPSTARALVLGLFLLHMWSLTARIVDVVDSSHDFGGFLVVMLWLFWMLLGLMAVSMGIGAVLLGRRGAAPVAAPVPSPQPPPGPVPHHPVAHHPVTGSGIAIPAAAGAAAGAGVAAASLSSAPPPAPPVAQSSAVMEPAPEPELGSAPDAERDSWADERWEDEVRRPARADADWPGPADEPGPSADEADAESEAEAEAAEGDDRRP